MNNGVLISYVSMNGRPCPGLSGDVEGGTLLNTAA
jgi:hypothetical protein